MKTEMMKKNTVLHAVRMLGMLLIPALAIGLRCAVFLPRFLH